MAQTKFQRFFIALILGSLAYEWLVSGISKLISGEFVGGLYEEMIKAMPDMKYQFYAHFLQNLHYVHAVVLGVFIEVGEIALGLSFAYLAIQTMRQLFNRFTLNVGLISGLVAAFLNLNFFLFQGGSFFVNPSEPFDEGVSIDALMMLFDLSVVVYYFALLREHTITLDNSLEKNA